MSLFFLVSTQSYQGIKLVELSLRLLMVSSGDNLFFFLISTLSYQGIKLVELSLRLLMVSSGDNLFFFLISTLSYQGIKLVELVDAELEVHRTSFKAFRPARVYVDARKFTKQVSRLPDLLQPRWTQGSSQNKFQGFQTCYSLGEHREVHRTSFKASRLATAETCYSRDGHKEVHRTSFKASRLATVEMDTRKFTEQVSRLPDLLQPRWTQGNSQNKFQGFQTCYSRGGHQEVHRTSLKASRLAKAEVDTRKFTEQVSRLPDLLQPRCTQGSSQNKFQGFQTCYSLGGHKEVQRTSFKASRLDIVEVDTRKFTEQVSRPPDLLQPRWTQESSQNKFQGFQPCYSLGGHKEVHRTSFKASRLATVEICYSRGAHKEVHRTSFKASRLATVEVDTRKFTEQVSRLPDLLQPRWTQGSSQNKFQGLQTCYSRDGHKEVHRTSFKASRHATAETCYSRGGHREVHRTSLKASRLATAEVDTRKFTEQVSRLPDLLQPRCTQGSSQNKFQGFQTCYSLGGHKEVQRTSFKASRLDIVEVDTRKFTEQVSRPPDLLQPRWTQESSQNKFQGFQTCYSLGGHKEVHRTSFKASRLATVETCYSRGAHKEVHRTSFKASRLVTVEVDTRKFTERVSRLPDLLQPRWTQGSSQNKFQGLQTCYSRDGHKEVHRTSFKASRLATAEVDTRKFTEQVSRLPDLLQPRWTPGSSQNKFEGLQTCYSRGGHKEIHRTSFKASRLATAEVHTRKFTEQVSRLPDLLQSRLDIVEVDTRKFTEQVSRPPDLLQPRWTQEISQNKFQGFQTCYSRGGHREVHRTSFKASRLATAEVDTRKFTEQVSRPTDLLQPRWTQGILQNKFQGFQTCYSRGGHKKVHRTSFKASRLATAEVDTGKFTEQPRWTQGNSQNKFQGFQTCYSRGGHQEVHRTSLKASRLAKAEVDTRKFTEQVSRLPDLLQPRCTQGSSQNKFQGFQTCYSLGGHKEVQRTSFKASRLDIVEVDTRKFTEQVSRLPDLLQSRWTQGSSQNKFQSFQTCYSRGGHKEVHRTSFKASRLATAEVHTRKFTEQVSRLLDLLQPRWTHKSSQNKFQGFQTCYSRGGHKEVHRTGFKASRLATVEVDTKKVHRTSFKASRLATAEVDTRKFTQQVSRLPDLLQPKWTQGSSHNKFQGFQTCYSRSGHKEVHRTSFKASRLATVEVDTGKFTEQVSRLPDLLQPRYTQESSQNKFQGLQTCYCRGGHKKVHRTSFKGSRLATAEGSRLATAEVNTRKFTEQVSRLPDLLQPRRTQGSSQNKFQGFQTCYSLGGHKEVHRTSFKASRLATAEVDAMRFIEQVSRPTDFLLPIWTQESSPRKSRFQNLLKSSLQDCLPNEATISKLKSRLARFVWGHFVASLWRIGMAVSMGGIGPLDIGAYYDCRVSRAFKKR
ncbi:hypothetical protein LAZ67_12003234 [Cordylochernes scorpioides]|uniref:Uncharacterized protein n=1 Tax=Cordylochernes scorpioides TaxID=51811 RepID=A0ABY6L2A5_9ARAC|nr:hypothetical protein LAZ67_12003234 [Cordylochernes scorpioides]